MASFPIPVGFEEVPVQLPEEDIIKGVLHDTVEEGTATSQDIAFWFGEEVAKGVDLIGVAKDESKKGTDEYQIMEAERDEELTARLFETVFKPAYIFTYRCGNIN